MGTTWQALTDEANRKIVLGALGWTEQTVCDYANLLRSGGEKIQRYAEAAKLLDEQNVAIAQKTALLQGTKPRARTQRCSTARYHAREIREGYRLKLAVAKIHSQRCRVRPCGAHSRPTNCGNGKIQSKADRECW